MAIWWCFRCSLISRGGTREVSGEMTLNFLKCKIRSRQLFVAPFWTSNPSKEKKHQFPSCFCVSCVTLLSERGSLVAKTTLTEHFFRWGFCEKFLSQGLSAALKTAIKLPSKHKFAQRGSETTKRISLFYIFQNIWSYWQKHNINSNCIIVLRLCISSSNRIAYFWRKALTAYFWMTE